jgi:phage shock protein PspC (stress-responsive transcriptional regulator)
MREVLTISLNGNAYQIEQGGYEALRSYLATAQATLSADPDKAEILADLEQAIAEKCDRYLSASKNVVTPEEMQQILAEMGPVVAEPGQPGAAGPEAPAGGATPDAEPAPGAATDKRLYQIQEGAMVSGVCMGLAAYFGVDVTIVRLIFVGLAFLSGGLFILAYIAMMLVIPHASTSEERAAAYGQPFNAAHLINAFRRQQSSPGESQWQQWRRWQWQARRDARAWRREWRRGQRQMRRSMRGWGPPPLHPDAAYGAPLLIGVLMPIFALLHVALVLLFVASIVQLVTLGQIFGWQPPPDIPLWADIVILVVLLNLFTEPLRLMRRSYYYHGAGTNLGLALWASLLWVGFMVACLVVAYQHWPDVQAFIEWLGTLFEYHHHPTQAANQTFPGAGHLASRSGEAIHTLIGEIFAGDRT